jgi:hypothetical protein
VTDLANLFDADSGIYANATGEGRAWERPCSLELLLPDGLKGFQENAGVRIRGGFSRSSDDPKHSLRFYFRSEYGSSKLHYPLFGPTGPRALDQFDLRTSQDGSWAYVGDRNGLFVNDPFARDTLLALGQPGERGDFVHLYINGQYWGLYNTCERPEASYAATYFGGEPEDYDVLKVKPDIIKKWKNKDQILTLSAHEAVNAGSHKAVSAGLHNRLPADRIGVVRARSC